MALSRSMKNLMHQSAIERGGGGNPGGGGRQGFIGRAMQQARGRGQYNPGGKPVPGGNRGPRGPVRPTPGGGRLGGRNPRTGGAGGPVLRPSPGGPPTTGGPGGMAGKIMAAKRQQALQRGGGGMSIGRPAVQPPQRGPGTVAGKPMPAGGTFGFASRGGGGTPALQEATAGARSQVMKQAAARPTGLPGAMSGAQQQAAMQRSRAAGPAALAKPRGQSVAARIGGQQGPPARRGGMARALGSGGSRRRMLR